MPRYSVTYLGIKQGTGVSSETGKFGVIVRIEIRALDNGKRYTYDGNGMGVLFEQRLRKFTEVGSIVVEADVVPSASAHTEWRQTVVDLAFQKVDNIT